MNNDQDLENVRVRQTIRLPTIKLKPSRLLADGEDHDSVAGLAHYLAMQCITCLINVVRERNPLKEAEMTSVIWLRANGDIELVRETNYRQEPSGDLVAGSLYIDAFRSMKDAIPFSRYHRWLAHPEGEFVGDMRGRRHCIRPGWNNASSIANTDAYLAAVKSINWTRLKVVPISRVEAERVIRKCKYREKLTKRIKEWILAGHYTPTLHRLNAVGLRRAGENYGSAFLFRYGETNYFRILHEKVRQALAEEAEAREEDGDWCRSVPTQLIRVDGSRLKDA